MQTCKPRAAKPRAVRRESEVVELRPGQSILVQGPDGVPVQVICRPDGSVETWDPAMGMAVRS